MPNIFIKSLHWSLWKCVKSKQKGNKNDNDRFTVTVVSDIMALHKKNTVYMALGLWECELRGDAPLCSLATNHSVFVLGVLTFKFCSPTLIN